MLNIGLASRFRATFGFTLLEIIFVTLIVSILFLLATPHFLSSSRQAEFEKKIQAVALLLERARSQALASEVALDDTNSNLTNKIPAGGFGVLLDKGNQTAILFQDDWNAADSAKVQVDYASAAERILPDRKFTAGSDSDTVLTTLELNEPAYLELIKITGQDFSGNSVDLEAVTIIFLPLLQEVLITNLDQTKEFQNIQAELLFHFTQATRTLEFNRITTTSAILKNN